MARVKCQIASIHITYHLVCLILVNATGVHFTDEDHQNGPIKQYRIDIARSNSFRDIPHMFRYLTYTLSNVEDMDKIIKQSLNDLPHVYTKRNHDRARNFHQDNERILRLMGYYPSRMKSSSNTTPPPRHQTRSPPSLHFEHFSSRNLHRQALPENSSVKTSTEEPKRNIFFSRSWTPTSSRENSDIIAQQQETESSTQPLKGFAFTSNHWGPMGKRESLNNRLA